VSEAVAVFVAHIALNVNCPNAAELPLLIGALRAVWSIPAEGSGSHVRLQPRIT
jgi:hypothetical protein